MDSKYCFCGFSIGNAWLFLTFCLSFSTVLGSRSTEKAAVWQNSGLVGPGICFVWNDLWTGMPQCLLIQRCSGHWMRGYGVPPHGTDNLYISHFFTEGIHLSQDKDTRIQDIVTSDAKKWTCQEILSNKPSIAINKCDLTLYNNHNHAVIV